MARGNTSWDVCDRILADAGEASWQTETLDVGIELHLLNLGWSLQDQNLKTVCYLLS